MQETQVWSLGGEDSLEKKMATPSIILSWKIPWTEEHGGLQSIGSQRVRHNWVHASLLYPSDSTSRYLSGKNQKVKWSESCSVMSDSLWPHGLYSPRNSPGQNTGVDSCSLLQGIFPTQGSNPGLPHCRRILYQLSNREAHVYGMLLQLLNLSHFPSDAFRIRGSNVIANHSWTKFEAEFLQNEF